jgi:hypothetical protein
MYTLFFEATRKTARTSEAADFLYLLVLLGTPAVANSNTKFKSFGVGTCLLQ